MGSKDAVEPIRHLHSDFCSPQFSEGLSIQDKQESTSVLQGEEKDTMNAQAELHSTAQPAVTRKGARTHTQAIQTDPADSWPGALADTDATQETPPRRGTLLAEVCLAVLGSCRGTHLGERDARTVRQSPSDSVLWLRKCT